MTPAPFATLLRPFETGDLDPPSSDARVLFLGAEPGLGAFRNWGAELACVNGFRPSFLALGRDGWTPLPVPQGDGYDMALVLAQKHRGLNEARIGQAWERVRAGGVILVAGGKEDGIDSLRKRTATLRPLAGALSKHHGVVFWLVKEAGQAAPFPADAGETLIDGRFRTAPGMFSHERADPGSKLLADMLPADLKGQVADFAAGWGYLATRVAERSAVAGIDLYEADHAALEAARFNLAGEGARCRFFWHDLLGEPVTERYHAIVMNPPFHTGRAAEPDMGKRLIAVASGALRKGGRLFLVANRGLPYEPVLREQFARHEELARDARYKVLAATR